MAAPEGNKYGEGYGRPPVISDPNQLDVLIIDYFEWIEGEKGTRDKVIGNDDEGKPIKETEEYCLRYPEPPTVTGLALHLGFADKSSLYDYKKKESFSHSIKRAITRIEKYHEIKASQGDKCIGNIFVLKNFGWTDKVDMSIDDKRLSPEEREARIQELLAKAKNNE